MITSLFRTAWRSIRRGGIYSMLNILGLATGMAVALLIGLWVYDQYQWNRELSGFGQAFQVKMTRNEQGEVRTVSNAPMPLWTTLRQDIPGIAYAAPAFGPVNNMLRAGEKRLYPEGLVVGKEFLNVFGFPMVAGDPATALGDPHSIVLTEKMARALFGSTDVLNKTVKIDDVVPLRVTAVVKDLTDHSSFHFTYLTVYDPVSATSFWKAVLTDWRQDFCPLYVRLAPHVTYAQVAPKIRMLVQQHAPEVYRTSQEEISMQPMKDWRLYTRYENGVATGGLVDYIRLFSIIGVLVLLIACINFMNLSTARSGKRAREVGIRKVVGSSRMALIIQFLAESVLLTGFAFGLSLLLVVALLPAFNTLTHTQIRLPWSNGYFWLILLAYVVMTGLLAGARPAFYLSGFRPVKVLKGKVVVGKAATLSRKVLVVAQFTASIALIIGTMVVYRQLEYARERPNGLDVQRLVTTDAAYYDYPALKQEVLRSGLVTSMTKSNSGPIGIDTRVPILDWEGRQANESLMFAMNPLADADYFRTVGMHFVAGRDFKGNAGADSTDVILNEAAVKQMHLSHPLGQLIRWGEPNVPQRLRIIGIVKDALSKSPFAPAEPTMYVYQPTWCFAITYRLARQVNTAVALAGLKTIFEKNDSRMAYTYTFVDQQYAAQFALEELTGRLALIFAVLAVFISCLGLFGLAAYLAEQRTKEIGIRKVLGATAGQVVVMLGREFIWLVTISCLIASPVAWYFLQRWLEGYYYRATIGVGVFVWAAGMALVITALTISVQSVRAAWMNPVKSLRND